MLENLPIEVKFSRWVVGDADPYEYVLSGNLGAVR